MRARSSRPLSHATPLRVLALFAWLVLVCVPVVVHARARSPLRRTRMRRPNTLPGRSPLSGCCHGQGAGHSHGSVRGLCGVPDGRGPAGDAIHGAGTVRGAALADPCNTPGRRSPAFRHCDPLAPESLRFVPCAYPRHRRVRASRPWPGPCIRGDSAIMSFTPWGPHRADLSRRRFVQGLALGGAAAGLGLAAGLQTPRASPARPAVCPRCAARRFSLEIGSMPVNFTGRRAWRPPSTAACPARCCAGARATPSPCTCTTRLPVPTSIHWHGILLPTHMDGVPGLSFPGIAPGETFTYRFRVRQSGTYWYHSHSGFQEQTGALRPAGRRSRRTASRCGSTATTW